MLDLLLKKEPPAEAQVRKEGPGADSTLVDIINDSDVDVVSRRRAIEALGFFDNKRSRQMLSGIITDPAWEKVFRIAALETIGRVMGEEAFEMVKDRALDPDAEVRLACVKALEAMRGVRALGLLRSLQLQEHDPAVVREIDKALGRLNRNNLEGTP
jgi:HEAT repeat protein